MVCTIVLYLFIIERVNDETGTATDATGTVPSMVGRATSRATVPAVSQTQDTRFVVDLVSMFDFDRVNLAKPYFREISTSRCCSLPRPKYSVRQGCPPFSGL